ncbi:MAG TPA: hypothetical protein VIL65_15855 [Beijerinckiaceae bacterium]|jgi:hypothetical protein
MLVAPQDGDFGFILTERVWLYDLDHPVTRSEVRPEHHFVVDLAGLRGSVVGEYNSFVGNNSSMVLLSANTEQGIDPPTKRTIALLLIGEKFDHHSPPL